MTAADATSKQPTAEADPYSPDYYLGYEAGWRGDELVMDRGPTYMTGYDVGRAARVAAAE